MRKRRVRPGDPERAVPAVKKPKMEYGPELRLGTVQPPTRSEDPELWRAHDALLGTAGVLDVLGEVIRDTFDQIYDGQYTGRWDYRQLNKTEKTHVGTLIQINVHKALDLFDGDHLDYKIAGIDVDCKWSMTLGGWEIPLEMYRNWGPQIALIIWANDYTSRWAAGLVRTEERCLRPMSKQRDSKRRLNEDGMDRVVWLETEGRLLQNTLLQLRASERARVLGAGSGQACVTALFREIQGRLVDRATVVTAGMQADPLKRVRDARIALRREGIVVFGHYSPHPEMAVQLGLPKPSLGTFVSARLTEAAATDPEATIEVQGRHWRMARDSDAIVTAPELPKQGREIEPSPVAVF